MMGGTGTTPRTSLSILLLFIALFLYHSQFQLQTAPSDSHNYIVRFLQYKSAAHHSAYLDSNLPSQGWRWIDRRNPAANFPTDFGLVSVDDSVKDGLTREILSLALVKDVHVDMGYKRTLLHKSGGGGGAFLHGTKNRPGKIFTSMRLPRNHPIPTLRQLPTLPLNSEGNS